VRVVEAINSALHAFLRDNPLAYVLGEDVLDPYGGAFKATKGLSTAYPNQVITTPISEAGVVGFATGLAIKGRPVCVEIMFGDFTTLCTDQIVNHMSKLPWVYNDQIKVPVVIRTPMGGRRGYGATHSQSLEKHFCGIPGLTVVALSEYSDIEALCYKAFSAGTPHLMIENKVSYAKDVKQNEFSSTENPDVVVISYGGCVSDCVAAAARLRDEEEIEAKVIEVTTLWPFDQDELRRQVGNCRCVLTVEEGAVGWGFSSEVCRALIQLGDLHMAELTGPNHPIPSSKLWEDQILPGSGAVIAKVLGMLQGVR
jgi:acetoin:2,6-dichlorophenolindophenol oxidoreductase subunit beta